VNDVSWCDADGAGLTRIAHCSDYANIHIWSAQPHQVGSGKGMTSGERVPPLFVVLSGVPVSGPWSTQAEHRGCTSTCRAYRSAPQGRKLPPEPYARMSRNDRMLRRWANNPAPDSDDTPLTGHGLTRLQALVTKRLARPAAASTRQCTLAEMWRSKPAGGSRGDGRGHEQP
jgi:hypothetical protein